MHVPGHKAKEHWNRGSVLLIILGTIFVAETGAMFLLPVLLPSDVHPWIEALTDAALLSFGSLPLLWFLLVRPMYADMRRSSHQNRSLISALDHHVLLSIADARGKITYANDAFCRISKFTLEELLGKDHRIVNSGHHPKSFMKNLWDTIKRGKTWNGEVQNRAKDGSLYWVNMHIVPFKDEAGRITQYVAFRQDITDHKEAEEALSDGNAMMIDALASQKRSAVQLERTMDQLDAAKQDAEAADRSKSEFLANMSHEIRTPMTAILGFAENIAENVTEPENVDAIATIRRNGEYLLGIINDILDLSKVEAGKMTMEQMACRPCQIIAEVASLVRIRTDAKGLAFNIEYIGDIPETIVSDPTRLRQILINLIGNAIKFTEDGAVRLVVRFVSNVENGREESPKGPYLQFDVLDTGLGMSEEQVATLFQPFAQADTTTTRKFGGTGLGLAISKRFAELLDGDITLVESEVGVGTRFRATVSTGSLDGVTMLEDPMSATLVAEISEGVAPVLPSDLQGLRILLAEDGPDNQRLISFVLKKAGADVTVEENGKLALETALEARAEGNPFDVILMDMQMPVMDGYEATGQLREKGYTEPIIALTAHAMDGDQKKCIDAGCDDYATKPIDRKKLIETIQHHLLPAGAASPVAT